MSPTNPPAGSPTDPPVEARVDALARETERTTRRQEEFENATVARVTALNDLVAKLADQFTQLHEVYSRPPQSWFLVTDATVARDMLEDLREWLDSVYLRYRDTKLRDCWAWHPDVVEELWVLRCTHRAAFSGQNWEQRAALWHLQQRPGTVERVRVALGTCDLSKHVSGGQRPDAAPLAAHLDDVADHWVTHGVPPEPTEQQLQHAREYDDLLLHRPSS